jgi:hypothetical protein
VIKNGIEVVEYFESACLQLCCVMILRAFSTPEHGMEVRAHAVIRTEAKEPVILVMCLVPETH